MRRGATDSEPAAERRGRWRRWAAAACLVVLFAFPVHVFPCGTQASHYALVRGFAHGTARIDEAQWFTCDKAWFEGHSYSVKAPALAAMALPAYLLLDRTGRVPADQTWAVWLLALTTVVPLALLLVWLVGRVAAEIAPDYVLFTQIAVGVGTLVLPFGSLWFGHVPAATLAFAAYVLIRPSVEKVTVRRAVGAGLLAGGAVLFEYPTAVIAVLLVVYLALTRGLRPAAWMCLGGSVPAVLLLLYNQWAFGSITHFSYEDAVSETGVTGHDVLGANDHGFFGIGRPRAHALVDILASPRGLLVVTPICVLGLMGIALRYRQSRGEGALLGSVTVLFVAYNAGYTLNIGGPFGGDAPGPRFLVAAIPFLMVPVGLAAARWPGAAIALLLISGATMLVATGTQPLVNEGFTDVWLKRLQAGDFVKTPLTLLTDGHGWGEILPFALAGVVLLGIALEQPARDVMRAPSRAALEAGAVLLAWLVVYSVAHAVYSDNVSSPRPASRQQSYANPRNAASTNPGNVSRL